MEHLSPEEADLTTRTRTKLASLSFPPLRESRLDPYPPNQGLVKGHRQTEHRGIRRSSISPSLTGTVEQNAVIS